MLDLAECDSRMLDDLDLCFSLLDGLPEKLAMTKNTAPHVFRYKGLVPEEQGITGVVVIAESHISVHTYPIKKYAFIDIFSCKPFDFEMATAHCVDFFKSERPKSHLVARGELFSKREGSDYPSGSDSGTVFRQTT
jgi:S-adenosylmethionine decarboxylase